MTERILYWVFGLVLGCAASAAIAKPLIAERGRKVIPGFAAGGIGVGILLGWAINAYIDYVRASATLNP